MVLMMAMMLVISTLKLTEVRDLRMTMCFVTWMMSINVTWVTVR